MEITNYRFEYLNACLSIFDSNKPRYFHEDERPVFVNFLNNSPNELYFVLKIENRIVACGGIYEDDIDIAGLSWGMVHRDFHHKGIGSFFTRYRIEKLKEIFPEHRYKIETSQHTFKFYLKMGFEMSHQVKDGFGLGLDKIVMWLK
ncbi:MAG: GNAT family N-acetyltransferase [Cytophagales bacterium]